MQVISLMGLPGTGKSTVTNALQSWYPNVLPLSTDIIREYLFRHLPLTDPLRYTPSFKSIVYNALFYYLSSLHHISSQFPLLVIIEATFHQYHKRRELYELSKTHAFPLLALWLDAPPPIIKQRLSRRNLKATSSQADYGVYEKLRSTMDPIRDDEPVMVLQTSNSLSEVLKQVKEVTQTFLRNNSLPFK